MNKKACEEEERNENTQLNNPLKIIESPSGKIIDFYLINEIRNIQDYLDFLREVENAKNEDVVKVHINNYGGALDVAMNIYDVLQQSKASIQISVEGACASAASMIMLAGNEWFIYPHAWVMIHSFSGVEYGKWNEMKASHEFSARVTENRFRKLYKNFLTDEEIEDCLKGKDFYFDNEETLNRIQNYQADVLKKQKAIQEVTARYQEAINKEISAILTEDAVENPKPKRKKLVEEKD